MIRRFFIWRAQRRMGRSRYRIDRTQYRGRGRLHAGFIADLDTSRFWAAEADPHFRAKRRKRRIITGACILLTLFMLWVIFESIRALRLF